MIRFLRCGNKSIFLEKKGSSPLRYGHRNRSREDTCDRRVGRLTKKLRDQYRSNEAHRDRIHPPPIRCCLFKEDAVVKDSLESISPYRLRFPLSPFAAAQIERVSIRLERIDQAFHKLLRRHQCLLVEGAGGLLVPITLRGTMADLAIHLKLPLLIIARTNLGTLNHSLLTVEVARAKNIPAVGVIFNHLVPRKGLAEQTNPSAIKPLLTVPILGEIPYAPLLKEGNRSGEQIRERIEEYVNMNRIRSLFL